MNDLRIRLLLIILLFALFSGVIHSFTINNHSLDIKNIQETVPITFNNWQGKELPLSEEIFEILQTQSILVREYQNEKGDKVTLAIIYYPDNQISFHGPEACLGGIGYTIKEGGIKDLQIPLSSLSTLQVKWLQYNRNHANELIYYFYATNNFVTPDYLTFRWQMLVNQLKYKQTNGALIRVSTPILSNSSAEQALFKFLSIAFPALSNLIIKFNT